MTTMTILRFVALENERGLCPLVQEVHHNEDVAEYEDTWYRLVGRERRATKEKESSAERHEAASISSHHHDLSWIFCFFEISFGQGCNRFNCPDSLPLLNHGRTYLACVLLFFFLLFYLPGPVEAQVLAYQTNESGSYACLFFIFFSNPKIRKEKQSFCMFNMDYIIISICSAHLYFLRIFGSIFVTIQRNHHLPPAYSSRESDTASQVCRPNGRIAIFTSSTLALEVHTSIKGSVLSYFF